MTAVEQLARDWRQFRLLSKTAVREMVDTALLARDADPTEFALWFLALLATPTAFFAARQMLTFTGLRIAPDHVVQAVALQHRLFFIVYAMLSAALLAALLWEALFPDGRQQEIVGTLPVRPYVFAASRLGAAVLIGVGFAAAVNLPAAVMYSVFAAGHRVFQWNVPGLIAGHALATMGAALLVFFVLLTLRGVTAVVFGTVAGRWLGVVLQAVTIVALFEAFFFAPALLGTLADVVTRGDPRAVLYPPVWFAGLHAWVLGHANAVFEQAMFAGFAALAIAVVVLPPLYLLPAPWLTRRALHKRSRERAAVSTALVRRVAQVSRATPPVRALLLFSVASLARSRSHALILAGYLGLAVAVCVALIALVEVRGSGTLDTPASWMLTLPLLVLFFSVIGLRASCRLPTEMEANWPLRMTPPSLAASVNATALTLFTLAVLPVALITLLALAPTWRLREALLAVLLQASAGVLLIEAALFTWRKVPFASAHVPSPDLLKAWWPLYALAMYLYAFRLADWQFAALSSSRPLFAYVVFVAAGVTTIRLLRARSLRRYSQEFDAVVEESPQLRLSAALD